MEQDVVAADAAAEAGPAYPLRYSILSVDENDAAREIRRGILEKAGFRVIDAANPADALRLAETEDPTLIVVKTGTADADGSRLCEQLKEDDRTASIPIILVSASGPEHEKPHDLKPLSDACLMEPVAPETLVAVTNALIREREGQRERRAGNDERRHLFETSLESIWVVDTEGKIQFVNERLARLLQYAPRELEGRRVWDLAPPSERERFQTEALRRIGADASAHLDVPLCRRDGSVVWLSGTGRNIRDENGVTKGRATVFMDITGWKQAQDALVESQERLALALDVAELGAWEADLATGVVTASPRTCAMFDFERARPNVDQWIDRLHPDDRDRVRREFADVMAGRSAYDTEYRVLGQDGQTRWIHAKARRATDARGHPTRLVGVAQDITGRKEAEAARERQRAVLQAIVEHIPVMLCLYDPAMETFQLNRECERVLGWMSGEASAGRFLEQVYPDPEYRREVIAYIQALAPGWREFACAAKSGETVPCEWANLRLPDERRLGIGIDLRPRKEAEEALRRSEASLLARAAELQAIMDALPVATFVARDPQCHDVIGSRMTYELLRLPCGSNVSASVPGGQDNWTFRFVREGREIPAHQMPAERAVSTGEEVSSYEFDIVFDDGSVRNLLGNAVPLLDDEGRPRGAVAAFIDITDRKRAEERLREAQKLESVGLLAGGIAHDFNNLLTAIMGNTSIVLDEVAGAPAARLKGILRSAERAASLIRQLLAYSGKGHVQARDIDVTQAVSEMRALMEISTPKSVRLSLDLEQRLPAVRLDPSQLEQIIMNLVINAGEAIGEGNLGRVRLATTLSTVDEPMVDAIGTEIPAGRYVRIEVNDTGSGIQPETLRRVFDPFFSTKFPGRGLGLAAVAGIVRSQRGAILVESVPGQGSTFQVLLPVSGGEHDEADSTDCGRGVILVVDDDDSVREFIGDVCRGMGYRVLTATDGAEALSLCGRERMEAVVLDVVMPVMGANVLLPQLKERQPDARILLTSGFSEVDARRLCADYPETAFVQKPYTARQLAEAIEALLAARK